MAQQIHLLPELQPVLLQWSKAVLRDRPEDVLTYSRDYFAEQATQRRMAGYVLPASESSKEEAKSSRCRLAVHALLASRHRRPGSVLTQYTSRCACRR